MKVWHKIVVAPGTAIVFLVVFGAVSYAMVSRQHAALEELYNSRFENYQRVAHASQAVSEVHSNVYRLFTWMGNLKEEQVKKITDEQKTQIDAIGKNVAGFAAAPQLDERERKIAEDITKKLAKYKSDVDTAIDLSAVDASTGMSMMQAADSGFQSMLKEFNQLVQIEKELAQASYDGASKAYGELVLALGAILAAALVVSAAITFFMSRAIVRPLRKAIAAAGRIAGGDLSVQIRAESRDETGELLEALRSMSENLKQIVAEVRTGSDTISTASRQIAAGNADLSQRTEEQASSLEETAASMEELTSTVRQNAGNAKQANQLAAAASEVALKGGAVVGEVVQTMSSINQSSKKIADIIGVIDGIAFQTNILALNAAVEAARAGEQGRGFAVVATEVRTLAQRSAAAAKEIKQLISDSVGQVDNGTRLVDQAGRTMDEIVASVARVTDIMGEISSASHEQTSGIEQVNQAVMQMDHMTQQNAALVEEAAAAAESMQEQAEQLSRTVAVFNVGGAGEPHAEPVRTERRSPDRARNVARLPARKAETAPRREAATAAPVPAEALPIKLSKAANAADDWQAF
jgi:methyl-accepting chemotaxis protein